MLPKVGTFKITLEEKYRKYKGELKNCITYGNVTDQTIETIKIVDTGNTKPKFTNMRSNTKHEKTKNTVCNTLKGTIHTL